jgi:serine protease
LPSPPPLFVRRCASSPGHGTHVTGTIAARRNGRGVVGVAPEATILTNRILDDKGRRAYASTVANAALSCYRDVGAKVINMSIGGSKYSSGEKSVFKYLYQKGVVSVGSAGNKGNATLNYPASYPSIVSVAAVNSDKRHASFSQRNSAVDLSAHGVSVYSTLPRAQRSYGFKSGTSMAAPHVAGVAALLFSKNPSATAAKVISAMKSTAEDLGAVGRDPLFGHGLVNAQAALAKV